MKKGFISVLILMLVLLQVPTKELQASTTRPTPTIEVGNIGTLGNSAKVPVSIRNITYLASGHFTVGISPNSNFQFVDFEVDPSFKDNLFSTTTRKNGQKVTVDFISTNQGRAQRLTGDVVIGYLLFDISASAYKGSSASIQLSDVDLKDQRGSISGLLSYDGAVKKDLMLGDVIGIGQVSPAASVKILQHINGNVPIRDSEKFHSADVDGDGTLTQSDALAILRHAAGLEKSFLAVTTTNLPSANVGMDYSYTLDASNGNAPYTWSLNRTRLPVGLTLNEETGEITGKATRKGETTFTVQVSDRSGYTAEKTYTMNVTETNIASIQQVDPIYVKKGETITLPHQVVVTYKDGSNSTESVAWSQINQNVIGTQTLQGTVGNTGQVITVKLTIYEEGNRPVLADEPIKEITTNYYAQLNVYTIMIEVSEHVYAIDILVKAKNSSGRLVDTKIPMHYEGESKFSLATPRLTPGQNLTLIVYDKFGKELIRKAYKMN